MKAACENMCEVVVRLDKQINGNGQPGLRQELQAFKDEAHKFFTESKTRDDEREKGMREHAQDVANKLSAHDRGFNRRVTIFGAIMTVLMAVIAGATLWHSYKIGDLAIPKTFHSQQTRQEYTVRMNNQDAGSDRVNW